MLAGCCDRQDFYFDLDAIALCIGLMISNSEQFISHRGACPNEKPLVR